MAEIPVDEIIEARNAFAEECILLREKLDRSSLMTRLHKRRIQAKVIKMEQDLFVLDSWLRGVRDEHNNS